MKWAQMPGGAADPVSECGTVEIDPLALVDLRLSVKRQVIGIFGDQNLGDSRFGRNAAFDQPRGSRCLDDNLLTGTAGIFGTACHQNSELGGHDIELLTDIFADPVQAMTATGAVMAPDVDDHIDARQMDGK